MKRAEAIANTDLRQGSGTPNDAAMTERQARWQREKRFGQVGYHAESGTVCFYQNDDDADEDYFYWIPYGELHSWAKRSEWVRHLGEKRWFNAKILSEFMDVLEALSADEVTVATESKKVV